MNLTVIKMSKGLLFFLAILGLFSCKKDELKKTEERLVGEWAWESSSGGLLGQILTPQTEGFEESYLFQKSGMFTHYRDTATLHSNFYWVERGSSLFKTGEVFLLYLGNQDHTTVTNTYSIEFEGENRLVLTEECIDCFEIIFNRKE
jgi:hypothetical protein